MMFHLWKWLNHGDVIDVYVISPNDGEGYVALSRLKHFK